MMTKMSQEISTRRPLSSINRLTKHILKQMVLESRNRSSLSSSILQNAYISLNACPVEFQSVEELGQLSGFESNALRKELQRKVEEWCVEHGRELCISRKENGSTSHNQILISNAASSSTLPARQTSLRTWTENEANVEQTGTGSSKQTKKAANPRKKVTAPAPAKLYVPQHRSGTHGIMIALYGLTPDRISDEGDESTTEHYFSKATIISHAQAFSDVKYIAAKAPSHFSSNPFSFNTAWSGMKTLINRGYVFRKGNPARFGLSSLGWEIGERCAEKEKNVFSGCFVDKEACDKSDPKQNEKDTHECQLPEDAQNEKTDTNVDLGSISVERERVPIVCKKGKKRAPSSRRECLDTSSADEDSEQMGKKITSSRSRNGREPLQSVMNAIRQSEERLNEQKELVSNNKAPKANVIDLISSDDIDTARECDESLAYKPIEPLSPLQGRQRRRRIS